MLRLVVLAAAMVLCGATLELRLVHAEPTFHVANGVPSTARAVRAAAVRRGLDGHVWLGKLRSVGGGRDTLIHVPRALDETRPIHVVIYMEGHGSFADAAMDHRHATSIARLGDQVVYVAPDAPSSSHGDPKARTPYWQAGCADRRCAGGHGAPGDFVVFLAQIRAYIAATLEVEPDSLVLHLSLVGFSNGGKGITDALRQLAMVSFEIGGHPVQLTDVVFADASYGTWLDDAWRVLAEHSVPAQLTVLVGADPRSGNHRRAVALLAANGLDPEHERVRVIPLRASHHAIGDAAVDFLSLVGAPVAVTRR